MDDLLENEKRQDGRAARKAARPRVAAFRERRRTGAVHSSRPGCQVYAGPALPYNSSLQARFETGKTMKMRSNPRGMATVLGLLFLWAPALSNPAPKPQQGQTTLRVDVNLVNVLCTVQTRQGQFVTDLNRQNFRIEEDGAHQSITHFAKEVTLPLTLGILIDTSPSVQDILTLEQQAAIVFLRTVLKKNDLAMIINFDRSVSLLQDFTNSMSLLEKAVYSLAIGGGTSLHDAVFLACDEKLRHEAGRKAIVLISDGGDTTSKLKIGAAIESAQRADTVIYAISNRVGGFYGRAYGGNSGALKRYARATGGTAFFPNRPQKFKRAFEAIERELRSQYLLSYQSSNGSRDGSYRSIKVRLPNRKGLKVKARKGYYARSS